MLELSRKNQRQSITIFGRKFVEIWNTHDTSSSILLTSTVQTEPQQTCLERYRQIKHGKASAGTKSVQNDHIGVQQTATITNHKAEDGETQRLNRAVSADYSRRCICMSVNHVLAAKVFEEMVRVIHTQHKAFHMPSITHDVYT